MNLVQHTLNEYYLVELLGQGSLAQVYQAYTNQGDTRHYVALKVFPPDQAILFQFGQILNQEMKVLTTFNHPNIWPILDFGQAEGYTYLAMPLHRGPTLTPRLSQAPLSFNEIDPFFSPLLEAISYAHQRGMVHGAIRADHVLFDEHQNCYLTDFALAKITPPSARRPQYPETNITPQSDIYALGILLYQLVTGDISPATKDWQPRYLNPALPLASIIQRATATQPQDRYDSVEAMQQAWQALRPATVKNRPTTPPQNLPAAVKIMPLPHVPPTASRQPFMGVLFLLSGLLGCLLCVLISVAYRFTPSQTSLAMTATIEAAHASDKPKPKQPPATTPSPSPPQSTPTATLPPPPKTDLKPGIACFGSFGMGATCLTEKGWQSFTPDKNTLQGELVRSIAICPNQTILMMHSSGISGFKGQTWTQYDLPGFGLLQSVACDNHNNLWVAEMTAFRFRSQGQWKTYPSANFGNISAKTNLSIQIAVAPDDTVWLVTTHSVSRLVNEEFEVFQNGAGFQHGEDYFGRMALDAEGQPWVLYQKGITHWTGQEWQTMTHNDLFLAQDLAIDPQGQLWVGSYNKGVLRYDGQAWQTYNQEQGHLTHNSVQALAIDAQGRVWATTNWGLNVFDGTTWQHYFMEQADLADNDFVTVAVSGNGPPLPPTTRRLPSGNLKGQLQREGQPLAGVAVEICVTELKASFKGNTPCANQPFQRQTSTDAMGQFTFNDLPRGHYVLAANVPGEKWYKLSRKTTLSFYSDERFTVKSGETSEAYPLYLLNLD